MNAVQMDPRTYLRLLWRWKLVFVAFLVGCPVAAFAIASGETKVYQSSVLIQEETLPVDTSLFDSSTSPTSTPATSGVTLQGLARVIETPSVAQLAARRLTPPASPVALLRDVTATADTSTGFITVDASATNPDRAADIANAFGQAVVAMRAAQAIGLLTTTIDQITAQLAQMGRGNGVARAQLSGQLQRLRALRAAQGSNAEVLQAAVPDASPVSPRIAKIVALGLLAGLLLGLGSVFLAEASDIRLRHPEDLEQLTGLRLLAVIPRDAFRPAPGGVRPGESFQMLRSALTYFNVDRPLSTVVIASPVKGDGKTTVATNLAFAAAHAGRDVVLVDADLRRPRASSRLGLGDDARQTGPGLVAVLTRQAVLEDCLVEIPIVAPDAGDSVPAPMLGRLRVLPAGGIPPNPSEIMASARMRELLGELEEMTDLVVIDTNPLLSVSDSLPLLDCASGVVLVARLHATTKDAIRRVQKTIANTSATVLGVVATGAHDRLYGGYGYGSGYGYSGDAPGAHTNGDAGAGVIRRRRASRQPS